MKKMLNTKGAAALLGCSENWVHKLVAREELKAYIYNEVGELVERPEGTKNRGAGLYFFESDLIKFKEAQAQKGKQTKPTAGERQYSEEQRKQALRLVARGMSNRQAAKEMGISYQVVNNWVKQELLKAVS